MRDLPEIIAANASQKTKECPLQEGIDIGTAEHNRIVLRDFLVQTAPRGVTALFARRNDERCFYGAVGTAKLINTGHSLFTPDGGHQFIVANDALFIPCFGRTIAEIMEHSREKPVDKIEPSCYPPSC